MKKNVVFLKVHKCASSTVSNIIQRFTMNYDLNPVLPDKPFIEGVWYWFLGRFWKNHTAQILPIPPRESYNTFFVHSVYNRRKFREIFPNDTFYFAILRDPVDRFVSYAFYFQQVKKIEKLYPVKTPFIFSKALSMHKIFKNIEQYDPAVDFGLYKYDIYNSSQIQQFIASIDKDFDFVMLVEYFDESLVYLRRQLCWTTKDIVYISQNQGGPKAGVKYALSKNDIVRIKALHQIDVALYDHFYRKFWKKINSQAVDFFQEVARFKETLMIIYSHCKYAVYQPPILRIPKSPWSPEFTITRKDCDQLMYSEPFFIMKLNLKMKDKYKKYMDGNQ
ncbi:hypothetical protein LOTGIDRAFT_118943 [Lottia gigantea]|uniref:Sulfotransferase domain-containing protein n=1 Tax=Lottia gigantea TaxID=225164 RepID=V4AEJ0_LOTGI|nr:hypothetical protein LOTGIDRAFT_118943 [Lottia gigantea]ESO93555.1 hypothetical protein LOTGIDRAFT_118943 [Lottia gigantea]